MEFLKVEDLKSLREALELGKSPIWTGEENLFYVLEKATEEMTPSAKISIRACRDIKFSKAVKYFKDEKLVDQFTNLSDFLMSTNKPIEDDDILVVTSNDYIEVFELIQQFINLGFSPKVYTEEDLVKKETVSKFLEMISDIKRLHQPVKEFLDSQEELEFQNAKEFLNQKILEIDKALKNSTDRTIKIAVFATKKTGKSMVVNCILGDEFAPTSLEIPTPNNIIYKPISQFDGKEAIQLDYENKSFEFNSPREIRKFIKEIFDNVKMSGKRISDMTISYHPTGEVHFEIIDTPGPDLYGSEHKEGIEDIIKNVDIAVFIIDYSKYAQDSEIKLFQDLKKYFERLTKQYSLICVVNKYDLTFQDIDTEKVLVRVCDFIREKIKSLGYDRFIVIPISALTWFYLNQIKKNFPDIISKEDIRRYLEDEVEMELDQKDELWTPVTFIQNIANYIRSTYRVKPSFEHVRKISNFDTFYKYLIEIANDKAKFEKIFSTILSIEFEITAIENFVSNINRINLDKKDKIYEELGKFREKIDITFSEINEKIFNDKMREIQKKFNDFIIFTKRESIRELERNFIEIINQEFLKLKEEIINDSYSLAKGEISKDYYINKYKNIEFEKIINLKDSLTNPQKFQSFKQNMLEEINKINSALNKYKEEILKDIKELEDNLNRKFDVNLEIRIPRLEISFNSSIIIKALSKLSEQSLSFSHEFVDAFFKEIIRGGFIKRILHVLFGTDLYGIDLEKFLKEIEKLEKRIVDEFRNKLQSHESMLDPIFEMSIQEFEKSLEDEFAKVLEFKKSFYEPIEKIQNVLQEDLKHIEKIIETIEKFHEKMLPFEKIWSQLLDSYRKLKLNQN